MLIWSRGGILGVIIPVGLMFAARATLEPSRPAGLNPPVHVAGAEDTYDDPTEEQTEAKRAAERKREADHLQDVKFAKQIGYFIGCIVGAAILFPLGRWLNRTETRVLTDPQPRDLIDLATGGGHTLFFIPLEYWSFVWVVIGLLQFV